MKGKNKVHLSTSLLLILLPIIAIIRLDMPLMSLSFPISILTLLLGIIMLNNWYATSYVWTCEVCGEVRKLSSKENFIYINIGINRKYFFCKECGVKRIFNGEYKY